MRSFFLCVIAMLALLQVTAEDNDSRYRYYYIEAARQQDMENYALAFELFRRCHEMKPEAAETNYALGTIYTIVQQDSLGLAYTRQAVAKEPGNTEYAVRLATLYLMKEQTDSAAAVYERLAQLHPDRTEYLERLLRIYDQQHDYTRMLPALNRLELQEGQSEDITLSKMRVYMQLGDQEGARRELQSLVEAHPYDKSLQVMMGNWLLSNGQKEEALNTFLAVLKDEPDNADGQMSLMDFYRADGKTHEADSLLYNMLINPRTEPATRIAMIRQWVSDSEQNGGDSLHVMQMFDRVLQLPQKTSEVAEMRAAYLILKKAPKDSIRSSWEKVLDITPENITARLQLIALMWSDSVDENVIRECKKAVEYVPDEPLLYYHLGVAQYINKHDGDAIATLKRGAGNITKDTPAATSADIYALLGDVLHKVGRAEEAYAAYDSCLIYDPNKVVCLNNYAYFLSVEGKDLKKAEKMSYRAITAEANNGTYLDTYAWILYQQQRYEEARIYIDEALRHEGYAADVADSVAYDALTDTVAADTVAYDIAADTASLDTVSVVAGDILEHAGDIYYRLGLKDDALNYWREALNNGVDDEATLRRKIKKQKMK